MSLPLLQMGIRQVLKIPFERIRRSAVLYDHSALNGNPRLDPFTRQRGYPPQALRPIKDHLWVAEERGEINRQSVVLLQTTRNSFQNLRSPLYSKRWGVCESADEQVHRSQRPFHGIGHLERGYAALQLDFRRPTPADVRFFQPGIPVLWEDTVPTIESLCPEVCDVPHLVRIDHAALRRDAEEAAFFNRYREAFERLLHAPAREASKGLAPLLEGRPVETSYLHNAVGVSREGEFLVLIAAHASLPGIGRIAQAAGASHCVVVDNGGSVCWALRRDGQFHALLTSYYYREPAICVSAYEIAVGDGEAGGPVPIQGASELTC